MTSVSMARAVTAGALALAVSACSAEVQPPPRGDDGLEPPSFPCEAAVAAEVVFAGTEVGAFADLIPVPDGYALASAPSEREHVHVTRIVKSLEPAWTTELPSTVDVKLSNASAALLADAGDGGVFVTSVDPAAGGEARQVAVRRLAADGSVIRATPLPDTDGHGIDGLVRRDDVLTLRLERFEPRGFELVRMGVDGELLSRLDATEGRSERIQVAPLTVGDDGTVVLAGLETAGDGEVTVFATAFSTTSKAWEWSERGARGAIGGNLRPTPIGDGHWLVTRGDGDAAARGSFRTLVLGEGGRVVRDDRVEVAADADQFGGSVLASTRLADGGVVIAVHVGHADPGDDWLVRLDRRARPVWRRRLDVGGLRPSTIRERADGGFVVAGAELAAAGEQSLVRVWSTDGEGRGRWRHDVRGPGYVPDPVIHADADGSVIVAGSFTERDGGGTTFVQRLVERCPE